MDRPRLELLGSLPVQDGGRIKPLSTFAGFTMLRLNGKRTLTTFDERDARAPVAWLLDVMLFPDIAIRQPVFVVSDVDAVSAIGVSIDGKKKRDRWTYAELQPGMPKLFSLAHNYDAIPPKDHNTVNSRSSTSPLSMRTPAVVRCIAQRPGDSPTPRAEGC